ncbi:hypothetical protein VTK73DRAFT_9974 [Phialemonium thermophilum]|uniref:Uncharacterized protein n=1 Tax=Phialemonium thermophilum TaxID=223376 RepID=A0ABR3VZA7_9PEZI
MVEEGQEKGKRALMKLHKEVGNVSCPAIIALDKSPIAAQLGPFGGCRGPGPDFPLRCLLPSQSLRLAGFSSSVCHLTTAASRSSVICCSLLSPPFSTIQRVNTSGSCYPSELFIGNDSVETSL